MHVVIDGRQTANDLHMVRGEMATAAARAWENLADDGARFMAGPGSEGRFFSRTGRLKSSMRGNLRVRGPFDMTADITANTRYAIFVDEGTRAHVIAARRAPFLRFFWARIGRWVRAKKVNHPGTTGRFFSRRTMRAFLRPFNMRTQAAIDSVAGRT